MPTSPSASFVRFLALVLPLLLAMPARAQSAGPGWHTLGTGVTGPGFVTVNAIATIGNDVYVAGQFNEAGGIPANNIARWDGQRWWPLGGGISSAVTTDARVTSLAVIGTDLYVGGTFSFADGQPVNHVARWDGTAWSALGAGLSPSPTGYVAKLAASGNTLYMTGSYSLPMSGPVGTLMRWNGAAWDTLGAATNTGLSVLLTQGADLYVGGDLQLVLPGAAPVGIAKWNGATWTELAGFPARTPSTMAFIGNDLFVSTADAQLAPGGGALVAYGTVEKWDGSSWTEVVNDSTIIGAMVTKGTDLYLGGSTQRYGSSILGKWSGTTLSSLSPLPNGEIGALAVAGNNLYVGGRFTQVDGQVANHVAYYTVPALGFNDDDKMLATPGLSLWPNPATATVRVQGTKAAESVRVYDVLGRLRFTTRATATGTATLDIAELAAGLYVVRCGGSTRRLVKE